MNRLIEYSTEVRIFIIGLLVFLAGSSFGAGASPAAYKVKYSRRQIRLDFKLPDPEIVTVSGQDGNEYVKINLPGAGRFAQPGYPALPVIHAFFETSKQEHAPLVLLRDCKWRSIKLDHPAWPAQEPVEKRPGSLGKKRFRRLQRVYSGTGFRNPPAEKQGSWYKLSPVKKSNVNYFHLELYLYSFNPKTLELKYPTGFKILLSSITRPSAIKRHHSRNSAKWKKFFKVKIKSRENLRTLVRGGFDISSVKGDKALVYGSDEEKKELESKGFIVIPEPGKEEPAPEEGNEEPAPEEAAPGEQPGAHVIKGDNIAKGDVYHGFDDLTTFLHDLEDTYPDLCHVESIGKSVLGRDIWAVKISDNVAEDESEPEVRLVSTMHGNEPPGMELCLRFMEYLLSSYGSDSRVDHLVDGVELWIVPLLNPDGYIADTRTNAAGIDLNRSFPDRINDPINSSEGRPPEVASMMNFCEAHNFVLAANFHTGSVVVNYPYDSNESDLPEYTSCPDDELFREISLRYTRENPDMWGSSVFTNGITNGAEWYVIHGGLQDWSYVWEGTNEVTIELWNDYKPEDKNVLDGIWNNNRDSLLSYIESVFTGVSGVVRDEDSGEFISNAKVMLADNSSHEVNVDSASGVYHHMFLPGSYSLMFWAPGYWPEIISDISVVEDGVTNLDVNLKKKNSVRQETILIVSSESLLPGGEEMLDHYRESGLSASILSFSGLPSASSIRSDIVAEYSAHPFDYLLLVGDTNTLPAFDRGSHVSDMLYSLLDPGEDWNDILGRDVVLGRLPFRSNNDIITYRSKLERFLDKNRDQRFAWITYGEDEWECGISQDTHQWVVDNVLSGDVDNSFYFCDQDNKDDFISDLSKGFDALIYSGHGRWNRWVKWNFSGIDLDQAANQDDPPVILSYACDTGRFEKSICFGESCIQGPLRGVLFLGGSDSTYWEEDDILEKTMFQAMFDADLSARSDLGEALYKGLEEVANQSDEGEYYSEIYHILGDPTLTLTNGFAIREITWQDGGNGVPEPGETGTLNLKFLNRKGFDLHDIRVLLEIDNADIAVQDMQVELGDLAKGEEKTLGFVLTIGKFLPVPVTTYFTLVLDSEESREQKIFPLTIHSISRVSGIVSFLSGGEPVNGALIEVVDSETLNTRTGETGEFAIDLNEGDYALRASYPGFCSEEIQVTVPPGRDDINFSLGWSEGELIPENLDAKCSLLDPCSHVVTLGNKGTRAFTFRAEFDVDRTSESGGYSSFSPSEYDGLTLDWIDTENGMVVHDGYEDDKVWGPYSLPFTFPFFGGDYNEVYISSNGFITFSPPDDSSYNSEKLPSVDFPSLMIAGFWNDIVVNSDGRVMMLKEDKRVVIEFQGVSLFNTNIEFSFQIILLDSGKILLQYDNAPLDTTGVVAGIQDETRGKGLTVRLLDVTDNVVLITDQPKWIRVDPSKGEIPAGMNVPLTFTFSPEADFDIKTINCLFITDSPRQSELNLPIKVEFIPENGFYFLRGDSNQDGMNDVGDVVTILSYLFSSGTINCLAALDTNSDENVDISDAVFLLSYLFRAGDPPSTPFPECGFYLDSDGLPCRQDTCHP